ncbi:MAG: MBL fold metallo-hydrolase [Myxococcales bacterium]|nr:MBL fold metallo-hydrolase [Myxococcales bacterium]
MKLRRIETPGIAHFAYLLTDGTEAAVVDPRRDVEEYLLAARDAGASIRYVILTHRQEDFVIGSAHLARLTGGKIVCGAHELFGHGDMRLKDGDRFSLGSLCLEARHTPGHTPESMSYAIFEADDATDAWGVFTGDTLFFGTTGRTDLPDENRAVENAARLYDSVHEKLADLGDAALVLPAHGPGSVCGSGMADRPWSTLGEEKRSNIVFTLEREAFAQKKGGERLPRPPYFRHMEELNLEGGLAPEAPACSVPLVDVDEFAKAGERTLLVDTREPEAFAGGHVPQSHNVWLGGLAVFGGWVADKDTPLRLLSERDSDVERAVAHLARIGIDSVEKALAGGFGAWRKSGRSIESAGTISACELASDRDSYSVLDVREIEEYDEGHISGAQHAYVGHLEEQLEAGQLGLDREQPLVVTCSVGHRAAVAVGILLRAGFRDVRNLLGGMSAWRALDLPIED